MVIIGLTGSIAMGKTTVAGMFRRLGIPLHEADAAVHRLLGPGGRAVAAVRYVFPEVVRGGRVDRTALGRAVFADPAALERLEGLLHPLVAEETAAFLRRAARRGARVVVLDVPLLLETGGERRCDIVAVVSAPAHIQRQRALARPGMTRERLGRILARQMPDAAKRRRADAVIRTGLTRADTFRQVRRLARRARAMHGGRWPPKRGWRRPQRG
jgi:dephospho-CoA kinase